MKNFQDYYFFKAKKENYPARSVYKLKEIDAKYSIFHKGDKVLDLGAAPGSWTLGAVEKIGTSGAVVACDLKPCPISLPANAFFFQDDIFEPSAEFLARLSFYNPFNIIMSDMAPATTGNKITDQFRSYELAEKALEYAETYLTSSGNFIVKIFMGPDTEALLKKMKILFQQVKIFKPKSSRSESKETFFLGLKKK